MRSSLLRKIKEQAVSLKGSVALRAVIFGLAWWLLPSWLFLLIALYLFFVPPAQADSVAIPFFALLVLCFLQPVGFFPAVLFGLIFWYMLLIKELYLIDRKSAYEMLILVLTFMLFRVFYMNEGGTFKSDAVLLGLLVATIVSALFGSFNKNFGERGAHGRLLLRIAAFVAFFLIVQFLMVGLFLPLDFVYQSSIVFLLTALLIEFFGRYLLGDLSRASVLVTSSVAFTLMVLLLGSARWGL